MTDETTLTGAPWTVEPGAIEFLPDQTLAPAWTVEEVYEFLSGGATALQAAGVIRSPEAFHLAGQHDQRAHGHKDTITSGDQAAFDKKVSKAKSGDKAKKATTSTDAYVASGPGGYGEHHKDTIVTPSEVGDFQVYGESVSGMLREGHVPSPGGAAGISGEYTAMSSMDRMHAHPKSKLKEDIVVERGIRDPHRVFGDDWHDGGNEGLTWDDAGFGSTTTGHMVAHDFATEAHGGEGHPVVMRMLVPKGTPAVAIGTHGTHPSYAHEQEVVLPRSMRYRVMRDHGLDSEGVYHIDVEVLGASDAVTAAGPPDMIDAVEGERLQEIIDATPLPKKPPYIDDGPPVKVLRWAVIEKDGIETAPDLKYGEEAVTAAADVHTGAMIALVPNLEDVLELVQPNGEDVNQLHVTMLYLGDADEWDDDARGAIHAAIADLAEHQPVVVGMLFGFALWNPDTPDVCLVANLSGGDLEDAHDSVVEYVDDLEYEYPDQHEPWQPHITLAYGVTQVPEELFTKTGPVTFDRVRVAFAGVTTDYPLGGGMLVSAGPAFHMPGQHDQSTHGGQGFTGHEALASAPIALRAEGVPARGDLTSEERGALGAYRNLGYVGINGYLRGTDRAPEPEAVSAAHHIQTAMARSPLTDRVTVTRGTQGSRWLPEGDNLEGVEFTERGFLSTTALSRPYDFTGRDDGVVMHITAPAGVHAIQLSGFEGEAELLFESGLTMRVMHDHGRDSKGIRTLDVEVIPK